MSQYFCSTCDQTFSNLSNLRRHNKRKHLDLVVCQIENTEDLATEQFTFYSDEDFKEWKKQLELDTGSSFIRRSGLKHRSEHTTVQYYQCHRSGTYTPLQVNRKRNLKTTGSIKIGAHCPAKIVTLRTVIDCAVEIAVKYVPTHRGHRPERRTDNDITITPRQRSTKGRSRSRSTRLINPVPPVSQPQPPPSPPYARDAHSLSSDVPIDGIIETQPGVTWIFAANSGSESSPRLETCEVDRVRDACEHPRCEAWCEPCRACLHPYQCTCAEYSIRLLVCKHVHRVAQINTLHDQPLVSKVEVDASGNIGGAGVGYQEVATETVEVVDSDKVLSLEQAVDEALRSELGTCIVKIPDAALDARRADLVTRFNTAVDKTRYATTHEQMDVLESLVLSLEQAVDNWQLHLYSQAGVAIPLFMCTSSGQ